MAPTPTLPQVIFHLLARQEQQQPTATVVVDSGSSDGDSGSSSGSSLNGGAIAGIVIGSIVGILLLWWIIRACAQPHSPDSSRQGWYDDTALPPAAPLPRSSRSGSRSADYGRHHHYHHHNHSSRRSGSRHHSRRRSSNPRPVVIEEKYALRRPSATYVYPPVEGRRSRNFF
ncbi:hypothetical protein MYCTH_2128790 [Thermothelomyces thermophilus ATCC 42464]|uniref:Mid2 domain-containing protein n=1 Tax=Thermothelomyces thermophilus (strain ATCC 42464 / BCRC 31852 / DSM 1799) TaxID=573729 RepID=G2QJE8_THET4|nr:uncharacterized protein MYCTH_2128790 [Thermothelomyces thermophilus ATCC 42464]AEO59705.1 hypothetical protein MYCTH_2128790 [Thermothelomyces thermophilus ATCC 42464]